MGVYVGTDSQAITALQRANRRAGQIGGRVTALRYGEDFFERRSTKGGQQTLMRYGREHYYQMQKLGVLHRRRNQLQRALGGKAVDTLARPKSLSLEERRSLQAGLRNILREIRRFEVAYKVARDAR